MKLLSWSFLIMVAALAAAFAVSNRQAVGLDLWPLPLTVQAPVYLLALGGFTAGFFVGGFIFWIKGLIWRGRAVDQRRAADSADHKAARLGARVNALEAAGSHRPALPPAEAA